MLILSATSRKDVLDVIVNDPFQIQGLVTETTVTEWDPSSAHTKTNPVEPTFANGVGRKGLTGGGFRWSMELTLLVTAELIGTKKHLLVIQRDLELTQKLLATYTKEREMPEKA